MATDLFGFAAGIQQADRDNAFMRKSALDERAAELDIKKAETELEQNEAFLHAISSGKVGQTGDDADIPDTLSNLGQIALKTGNIDKGKELITAGSTIRNQQSLMNRREAKTQLEHLNTFSNMLAGVEDQAGWDRANAQYQMLFGEPSPYAQLKYTPGMARVVQNAVTSAKDKTAVAVGEARRKLIEAQEETERKRRLLVEEQTKVSKQRAANLEKVGTKPVPSNYISAVTDRLKDEFENAGDRDLRAMALPLAEQAYSLVMTDGLPLSQAVERVVADAQETGELGGLTPISSFSAGTHRDKPLPIPTDKAGKIDPKKMKVNHYYQVPGTGQTVLYTKSGKFLVIEPDEELDDPEEGVDDVDVDGEEE